MEHLEHSVSLKAVLVVLWACLIAGAAIASENYRLCDARMQADTKRLHAYLKLHEDEAPVDLVDALVRDDEAVAYTEFDVTS
jgi:hypothetical protein